MNLIQENARGSFAPKVSQGEAERRKKIKRTGIRLSAVRHGIFVDAKDSLLFWDIYGRQNLRSAGAGIYQAPFF